MFSGGRPVCAFVQMPLERPPLTASLAAALSALRNVVVGSFASLTSVTARVIARDADERPHALPTPFAAQRPVSAGRWAAARSMWRLITVQGTL